MRTDARNLLRRFVIAPKQDKLKAGDLLLTAEVHRVMQPFFSGHEGEVLVNNVLPECSVCKNKGRDECSHMRVMQIKEGGGQQALMKLKPVDEQHHVDLDIDDFMNGSDSFLDQDAQDRILQEVDEYVREACRTDGFAFDSGRMGYQTRIVVDLFSKE